jgi:hypothetical protein
MNPVVVISRTTFGDGVLYERFEAGKSTHAVKTGPVERNEEVPTLNGGAVEQFRIKPAEFLAEVGVA